MKPEISRKTYVHAQRIGALHLLAVFVAIFLVYFATAPRTVVLEDDGFFVLASYFLGLAHPPGYPLYTLLGKLFTLIPIGSVAFRVHLLSAFFGSASCAALWWCARLLGCGRAVASGAALSFGLSMTFWSQAIIAEVYTLNVFFFLVLFGLLLQHHNVTTLASWSMITRQQWGAKDETRSIGTAFLAGYAFLYGLSWANHWPLMIMSTPALGLLLWPYRIYLIRKLPVMILAFVMGLTPYAWMVWRSQEAVISLYGPISSWQDFWFYVSRAGYDGTHGSITASVVDKLQYIAFFVRELVSQFTPFGFLIVIIGLAQQRKRWPLLVRVSLMLGFLVPSLALLIFLNFDYDHLYKALFRSLPLPVYSVLALWLALGIETTAQWIARRCHTIAKTSVIPVMTSLVVVSIVGLANYGPNNRREYNWSREFATAVLTPLQANAAVFTHGDVEIGTLGYFHLVEKLRPDIVLYNRVGLMFDTRLFPPVTTDKDNKDRILREFIAKTSRPVYYLGSLSHQFGSIDFWLYHMADKDAKSGTRTAFNSDVDRFAAYMFDQERISDPWTMFHRRALLTHLGAIVGMDLPREWEDATPRQRRYLDAVQRDFFGSLGLVDGLLANPRGHDPRRTVNLLQNAALYITSDVPKRELASFFEMSAILQFERNNLEASVSNLKASVDAWPAAENPAVDHLLIFYDSMDRHTEQAALKQRISGKARITPMSGGSSQN